MDARYTHFSEPSQSMLQSVVNESINKRAGGTKGLNPGHEKIRQLNKALQSKDALTTDKKSGILQRIGSWITGLFSRKKQEGQSDYIYCFHLLEQYLHARLTGNQQEATGKLDELRFSDCDPDWIRSVTNWLGYYVDRMKRPKYVVYPDIDAFSYSLPTTTDGTLKVGIIGDWGTGEAEAEAVLDQLFRQKPDVIIHVGDIYYSGTEQEYKDHYIDPIRTMRAKYNLPVPVYNLPGNHDYYSGGHAFYDSLSVINAGLDVPVQEASYFALSNEAWHLQGMDTGFYDNDVLKVGADTTHLKDTEIVWHQHQLDKAIKQNKKVILLSHHQLFSRYMAVGGQSYNAELMNCFDSYIQKNQIAAWLWGHEHLLEVYKPFKGLTKGRCIGNGAVPIFYNDAKPYLEVATHQGKPIPDLPESQLAVSDFPNNGDVYDQGFALLTLHSVQHGTASYYVVKSNQPANLMLVYEEEI